MAETKRDKVSARQRATSVLADRRAAEAERERKVTVELTTVLAGIDAEQKEADKRDAAIADARSRYASSVTEIRRQSGAAVAELRKLGETVASIIELTGLSRKDVTELVDIGTRGAKPESAEDANPPQRETKTAASTAAATEGTAKAS